jgi:hypothetical protein
VSNPFANQTVFNKNQSSSEVIEEKPQANTTEENPDETVTEE